MGCRFFHFRSQLNEEAAFRNLRQLRHVERVTSRYESRGSGRRCACGLVTGLMSFGSRARRVAASAPPGVLRSSEGSKKHGRYAQRSGARRLAGSEVTRDHEYNVSSARVASDASTARVCASLKPVLTAGRGRRGRDRGLASDFLTNYSSSTKSPESDSSSEVSPSSKSPSESSGAMPGG